MNHGAPAPLPFLTWVEAGSTCRVDITVVTNARRTEAAGLHDGALRVRLAARPIDGAANEALRQWLADQLDVAPSRVKLLRGATSRRKLWEITQADRVAIEAWAAALPTG